MISAESMDREYYDLDQLQTVILDAVNDYNEKNPDAISIDYYHVEGELATLILTYQNADHCTAFNEQPVLYGPAAEAWEQGQMDGQVRVTVGGVPEQLSHLHGDTQLFPALPHQGLLTSLSRLHFAAHKLPQQPTGLVGRTLTGQKAIPVPDEGGYHLSTIHCVSSFELSFFRLFGIGSIIGDRGG
jgi:hypothetical protein